MNRRSGCCRPMPYHLAKSPDDSYGNRTRVTAVKGRCLNRLTKEPHYVQLYIYKTQTPRVGLEPTTPRLTAVCSTIELSRIIYKNQSVSPLIDTYKVCIPSKFHMESKNFLRFYETVHLKSASLLFDVVCFTLVKPSTD